MTTSRTSRRTYIDWLRGVAVVVMIFAHAMDAWTRDANRATRAYGLVIKVSGMAAPLFLFLAGVALVLAGGARLRQGASRAAAGAALRGRGWEIFGLAFLFRLQAWLLSPGATLPGVLKVDILNIMGLGLVLAATLWGALSHAYLRLAMLAIATAAFSLLTPPIRASAMVSALPDWLEWYLRPPAGEAWFTLFPWVGLLLGGTVVGEAIDRARGEARERATLTWLTAGGVALFAVSLVGSYFPSLYTNTYFWTTAPSYFFLRIGLMTALFGPAWLWCRRLTDGRSSPFVQLGRSSLFVYWIHVELAYGILTWPIHRSLPTIVAFVGFIAFTILMFRASVAKDRWMAGWKARHAPRGREVRPA